MGRLRFVAAVWGGVGVASLVVRFVRRRANARREARVAEQEARDGHLSREQRIARMQEVVGRCGADDKQCMRELLGQAEGATDEDPVRF